MNAIKEVWNKYHANLLAFIQKRVNDQGAAEDILQNIFVRVHSRIDTLESNHVMAKCSLAVNKQH